MSRKQHKPTWLLPFGLIILMIVALVLESKDGLPGWANEAFGIGVVFFVFGLIALWVHLNAATLQDEELERTKHEKLVITEYPPIPPQSAHNRSGNGASDDAKDSFNNSQDAFQINPIAHYRN